MIDKIQMLRLLGRPCAMTILKKSVSMRQLTGLLSKLLFSSAIITLPLNAEEAVIDYLSSPASSNSSLSRLVRGDYGEMYLSWVSQTEERASLVFSKLSEEKWTLPEVIAGGTDWFVNWADFPALSVNNGNMTAHWLQMSAPGTYDYDIKAKFYNAKTGDWSSEKTIHDDGIAAEHGFVSMLPMSVERTFVSWLDGRQTKNKTGNTAMTLRAAVFDKAGETLDQWQLDAKVCDCCQTSAALTAKGPIVVYRDRSDEEIRDIYITRLIDDHWSEPQAVFNDEWEIAGCPVNGPAVAAKEEFVAVTWFSAKADTPEVKLVLSINSGESFSAPILVASPETNGRVDTAILESGNVVVSWISTQGTEAEIMLNLYSASGELISTTKVAETSVSRRSGFPILESLGESAFLTWTDITSEPEVRVAKVSFQN